MEAKTPNYFCGKAPCKDCPYRTDAPLKKWDKAEYEGLIKNEENVFSPMYLCHKKNGTGCKGWLMDQYRRNLPNMVLRMALIKNKPPLNYFEKLRSPVKLYANITEMVNANYPELITATKCDNCGETITGQSFPMRNENFKKLNGYVQCEKCFINH